MLNLPELEREWLHYKIKSFIPHFTIALSVVVISIIAIAIVQSDTTQDDSLSNAKAQIGELKITEKKELLQSKKVAQSNELIHESTPLKSEQVYENREVNNAPLKPSLHFMKEMQNSVEPYYTTQEERRVPTPTQEVESEKIQEDVSEPIEREVDASQNIKISIQRRDTDNDIKEIISRFKKNNNPALSLFIAKKYYELENYEQSYNYALITNKINNNIESSWIIFTKSLAKMGKRDMAIKTLKEYVKQSPSSSAKILLNEIESGKFK